MKPPLKITLLGGAVVWLKDEKATSCKFCKARIYWAITSAARNIPICKDESNNWFAHFANCNIKKQFASDGDRLDEILEQRNRDRRMI